MNNTDIANSLVQSSILRGMQPGETLTFDFDGLHVTATVKDDAIVWWRKGYADDKFTTPLSV